MPRFLMLPATCRDEELEAFALIAMDDDHPLGVKEATRAFAAARAGLGQDSWNRDKVAEVTVRASVRWYDHRSDSPAVWALLNEFSGTDLARFLDDSPEWLDTALNTEDDCLVFSSASYYWRGVVAKTGERYETAFTWHSEGK